MTADDEIGRLYGVDPADFTALRSELVAAAKERGDAEAAKRIAGARRPTTAAWVVNVLMRSDGTARTRLTDLAERLRAAHASMDGGRIRELSAGQRRLVHELTRTGFAAVGLAQPSAALRDDVVGTLQAAIAAPDVLARLGSLAKAERWSGFGEFGEATPRGPAITGKAKAKPSDAGANSAPGPAEDEVAAAKERVTVALSDVETAEREHAAAAAELSERTAGLATARRRYEKLLEELSTAEGDVDTAEVERGDAGHRADAASDRLDEARSALAQARSQLGAMTDRRS